MTTRERTRCRQRLDLVVEGDLNLVFIGIGLEGLILVDVFLLLVVAHALAVEAVDSDDGAADAGRDNHAQHDASDLAIRQVVVVAHRPRRVEHGRLMNRVAVRASRAAQALRESSLAAEEIDAVAVGGAGEAEAVAGHGILAEELAGVRSLAGLEALHVVHGDGLVALRVHRLAGDGEEPVLDDAERHVSAALEQGRVRRPGVGRHVVGLHGGGRRADLAVLEAADHEVAHGVAEHDVRGLDVAANRGHGLPHGDGAVRRLVVRPREGELPGAAESRVGLVVSADHEDAVVLGERRLVGHGAGGRRRPAAGRHPLARGEVQGIDLGDHGVVDVAAAEEEEPAVGIRRGVAIAIPRRVVQGHVLVGLGDVVLRLVRERGADAGEVVRRGAALLVCGAAAHEVDAVVVDRRRQVRAAARHLVHVVEALELLRVAVAIRGRGDRDEQGQRGGGPLRCRHGQHDLTCNFLVRRDL
mmetsp:Transcript_8039/g.22950  ORF Transcript_8039/g.22950 Transcript_8039/m.22950 type:complete len:471 (+) Transcript_8039:2556-3968(+)